MTKFFHPIRKVAGLYNAEKLLKCEARFVRTDNTAGIEADTQAALRRKNKIFRVDCPMFVLNNDLRVSENAALVGTPFTSFTASPLRGPLYPSI